MPDNFINIAGTDITDNFILFVLGETEDGYEVLQVDLDDYKDKVNKKGRKLDIENIIMSYSKERVKGGNVLDFHVRGPSAPTKENQMINQKTMLFFMHQGAQYNTIYVWPDPKRKKEVGKISKRVFS